MMSLGFFSWITQYVENTSKKNCPVGGNLVLFIFANIEKNKKQILTFHLRYAVQYNQQNKQNKIHITEGGI